MTDKKFEIKSYKPLWVMLKYSVLPWMVGAGLFALFVVELQDLKGKNVFDNAKFEKVFKINTEKTQNQR